MDPVQQEKLDRTLDRPSAGHSEHLVQFYESDTFLIDAVARYVGAGLRAGDAAVIIATAAHRRKLDDRLAADGFDLACASGEGRYVALDAAETVAAFMSDGGLDARGLG